jgi:glycosyltransferase involved in cell wall biosynthesis
MDITFKCANLLKRARLTNGPRVLHLDRGGGETVRARLKREFPDGAIDTIDAKRVIVRCAPLSLWRRLRSLRCEILVLSTEDARFFLRPFIHAVLCLLIPAGQRWLYDAEGRAWRLRGSALLVGGGLKWLAELLAAPLIVIGGLVCLILLPRRDVSMSLGGRHLKRVCFSRVHFFRRTYGGTLTHALGILRGLSDKGINTYLTTTDPMPLSGGICRTIEIPPTWAFRNVPVAHKLLYNLVHVWTVWCALKKIGLDAVYQRNTELTFSGVYLAWLFHCPFVLAFNSSAWWRSKVLGEVKLPFISLVRYVERVNLRCANLVVVVSTQMREILVQEWGVDQGKILVNPSGVDPEKFRPDLDGRGVRESLGIPTGRVVVGFCGEFTSYQGLTVLAKAASQLANSRYNRCPAFLLIGEGGERERVEKMFSQGVPDGMAFFLGAVPYEKVERYLAACDICVAPQHQPGIHTDQHYWSPLKIFEYMAMGRAIVASRVGQIAEVLEDGVDGLLVPTGDAQALAEAILRLAEDEDLRRRLGEAARKKVVERHTWQRNVERVLVALEKLQQERP